MFEFKQARTVDVSVLARMSREIFTDTYLPFNRPEDVSYYTTNNYSEAAIATELRMDGMHAILGFNDKELLGYASYRTFLKDRELEICRFYVYKKFHGLGAAKAMLDSLNQIARDHEIKKMRLIVWNENQRAIAFYKKHGFQIVGETDFDWGTGKVDLDYVMTKDL